jgi:hypothetical protein
MWGEEKDELVKKGSTEDDVDVCRKGLEAEFFADWSDEFDEGRRRGREEAMVVSAAGISGMVK